MAMAVFSVRFQRITLYLLLALTVMLIYQIYNHSAHRGKLVKAETRGESETKPFTQSYEKAIAKETGFPEGKDVRDGIKRRELHKDKTPVLQKQVRRLKSRVNQKEELIQRLTLQLEKEKSLKETFKQEVGNLKIQNAELLAEVEGYALGDNSGKSEAAGAQTTDPLTDASSKVKLPKHLQEIQVSERIQFQSFAKTHIFEVKPQTKPKEYIFHGQNANTRRIKSGRRHLVEVQDEAIKFINKNTSYSVTRDHVLDGVYRIDVNTGIDYELYFKEPASNKLITVRLIRPFGPMQPIFTPDVSTNPNELINLILPLSGRLERFQQFVDTFVEVCIKADKHVFLTVVLYGATDFDHVKATLKDVEATYGFKKYQLIMRDKPFSRGRALHDGVMYWNGNPTNVLMFFCDVDITFRPDFLRRCRMYSESKRKVYYPMVFSLYNPKNVYEDGNVPVPSEQLKVERTHGFWRAYGFGMTCQYRADYLRVGGFDLNIEGWGSEDLQLYQRYLLQPNTRIIRAPDRDLFHYYHDKKCDPSLTREQYRSCLGSKAVAEGTHTQIAIQLTKLREKYEAESQGAGF